MRRTGFFVLMFGLVVAAGVMASGQQQAATEAGPVRLSYWEGLGRAAQGHSSLATHPGWIELQNRLGIEIEFLAPAVGNETEAFNLMMASRNFPDIITYGWLNVPGGPARYIEDRVIIELNEPITKWAPNLQKAFETYPTARREAVLDDGTYYVFPQIYANSALAHWYGPMVRRDLLDKVPGFNVAGFPNNVETLAEWETLLTAVKNSGLTGDSGRPIIPLSFNMDGTFHQSGFIVGAWGIGTRFTHNRGVPVHGPTDPRYLEFLRLMKRWYDNGLLDPEFAANTNAIRDEKVLDNRVFAMPHAMGGGVTRYTGLARPQNPDFLLNLTKYPVLVKGQQPLLGFKTPDFTGTGAAITTAATNVEAAATMLDYDYSEEGYNLANFGIEGETFNWIDGYPRYSDLIMSNPQGFSRDIATGVYVRVGNHVGIKSPEFLEQRDNLPEQVGPNGRALWMATSNDVWIPPVTPTPEESAEFSRIMTEINTYVDEMTIKFIMGDEPLTRFDEFVRTQQRMGVERATQIMRDQLTRFFNRP